MTVVDYELDGKVIAITGASGYIGSLLTNELKKYSVKLIRISRERLIPSEKCEDWVLDLTHLESWKKIVKKSDIVFHLAGNTSINSAEQDTHNSLLSTLLPISYFIKASTELDLKPKIIFASTATVYGLMPNKLISESEVPNPISTYDMHKYLAEQLLINANSNNLINVAILRLANVYGPSVTEAKADDRGILTKVTRMAFEGKDLLVYGDGNYIRDYIFIDDVVNAFLSVSSTKSSEIIFNVSTGIGSKIIDVFNLISVEVEKVTLKSSVVKFVEWPKGSNEIDKRNFIGSSNLLRSQSNWNPKIPIEDGIKRLVSFYAKEY